MQRKIKHLLQYQYTFSLRLSVPVFSCGPSAADLMLNKELYSKSMHKPDNVSGLSRLNNITAYTLSFQIQYNRPILRLQEPCLPGL
jgi:hypothetical protein